MTAVHNIQYDSKHIASEVTTLWCDINLYIVVIIIIIIIIIIVINFFSALRRKKPKG